MDNYYPLALKEGTILNNEYTIKRVLGQGGFGITYEAALNKNGESVAIKEYLPETMASRDDNTVIPYSGERGENFQYGMECFLEEARTLSQFIGNMGIVGVKKYFEENGTAYFVMEYIKGRSFKVYLEEKGGKISIEEAIKIFTPVMDALSAVHATGMIHRDVTPDNIYVTDKGEVRLLDFGAARYSMGDRSMSLDVVLKHGYAPKEQYTRHGRQGPYTDIYSLAATIYRSITGKMPQDALDRLEVDELELPSRLGVRISEDQEKALIKALAVDHKNRYQSMDEFKADLIKKNEPARKIEPARIVESAKVSEPVKIIEPEKIITKVAGDNIPAAADKEPVKEESIKNVPVNTEPTYKESTALQRKRGRSIMPVIVIVIAILAIVGTGVFALTRDHSQEAPKTALEDGVSDEAAPSEVITDGTEEVRDEVEPAEEPVEETGGGDEPRKSDEPEETADISTEYRAEEIGVSFKCNRDLNTRSNGDMLGISYKDGDRNRDIFIMKYGPCGEVDTYPGILNELAEAADINMQFTSDLTPITIGNYPGWSVRYSYSAQGNDYDSGIVYLLTPRVGSGRELTMMMGDATDTMNDILTSIMIDGAGSEDLSSVNPNDVYKME